MTIDDGRRRAQGWEVLFHERTPQSRAAPRLMPSAITGVCDLFSAGRFRPYHDQRKVLSAQDIPNHHERVIVSRLLA